MREQADWADLSEQLLLRTFESQHNALDNCAAACACKSWRSAVNSSHIQSLHLHAHHLSDSWRMSSFLKSRCPVGELRLTAGHCFKEEIMRSTNSSRSFPFVTLLCDSLHIDMSWAQLLHVHTDALAQVKHLETTSSFHAANEQYVLSPLQYLRKLKTLTVHAEYNGDEPQSADAIRHSMRQCPATLEQLAIHGLDICYVNDVSRSLEYVLGTTLAHLTCLQLTTSYLCLDKGSLTCFMHLRSLSFERSDIYAAVDFTANLTWLSRLTSLNLGDSTWFNLSAGDVEDMPESAAFTSFHGWPALKVLKIDCCNLFGLSTALYISEVQDVQVYYHSHVLGINRVRVHASFSNSIYLMSLSYLPHCACFLVDLRVVFPSRAAYSPIKIVQGMQQLLSSCQSLQVLRLIKYIFKQPDEPYEQADLVLQVQQAVSLQNLWLQGSCFTQIDLSTQIDLCRACSLTSIVLKNVDTPHHTDCELFLPRSLRCFEFKGRAPFAASSQFKIEDCDSLTKLCISASSVCSTDAYNNPVLPSSLHHLGIFRSGSDHETDYAWVNNCDWQCLSACINLERLTVPTKEYLTPWMRHWVKSARHVHVVKYESG